MPEQASRSIDREEVDLPDEVQTSSGSWFSEKLKAAGFPSVDAFARHTGVPKSTAYQWERGSGAARPTNRPSKERILQLEEVLKVPATELVEKLWREKDGDPCPCGCGGYKSFEHTPPEPRRLWIVIPCAKCRTTENRSYKPWKKDRHRKLGKKCGKSGERAEYTVALLSKLPEHISPLVEFLYLSGWRKGEAIKLEWRDVNMGGQVVRLRSENSKNKEPRVFALNGRALSLIQERVKARRLDCPYVFHQKGNRIGEFRKTWQTACVAAGLGRFEKKPHSKKNKYHGTIAHDLRRCAARNLSFAGVPEAIAMRITGHKTQSMYRRYRIVDERDLRDATARLEAHLENQPKTATVEVLRDAG